MDFDYFFKLKKNSIKESIFCIVVKPSIVAGIFCSSVPVEAMDLDLSCSLLARPVFILSAIILFYPIIIEVLPAKRKYGGKKLTFVLLLDLFCIAYIYLSSADFRNILNYFFYIFFLITSSLIAYEYGRKSYKIETKNHFFKKTEGSKIQEIITNILLLPAFCLVIQYYSSGIYPYLSIDYGGNFQKKIKISLIDSSTLDGRVLHSTQEYLFVIKDQSTLLKINLRDIKGINIK
jgi:hypothetical protein